MPTSVEDMALSLRRTIKDKGERLKRAREVLAGSGLAEKADTTVHACPVAEADAGARRRASRPIRRCWSPTSRQHCWTCAIPSSSPTDCSLSRQQLILVTHDLDLALRCDRILVIDDARVAFDGAPAEAVVFYRGLVES